MKHTFKFFQIVLLICGVCVAEADEVKTVSVMEGESVTLNTGLTETQEISVTLWRFGESGSTIAQINEKQISYPNPSHIDIFRGKLQLDQTGSLTIKNMRTKHSGLYKVEIDLNSGSLRMIFNVTVSESPSVVDVGEAEMKTESVIEGNSVTLQTDVTETNGGELIVWRFERKLIAKHDAEAKSSPLLNTDVRFRDRLQLDHQTGSLTITHTRNTDSGEYTLKINSNKQTFYKRFSVTVSAVPDPGLSSGAVAGIVIVVLLLFAAAAAAGVIYYQRKISELERQKVMTVSVKEGNDVTLNTGAEPHRDDHVEWRFGDRELLIAEISRGVTKIYDIDLDERFRDRLKLDKKTGSLTIMNTRNTDTGEYLLKISQGGKIKDKKFNVSVCVNTVSVFEGDPVTLNPDTEIQSDDLIKWRFGNEDLITETRRGGVISINRGIAGRRFRDRLELNRKTGSLTITDTEMQHAGVYQLQITSNGEVSYETFRVDLRKREISVEEGKNLIINPETEIQKDDQIQWRFGDILIAEIRGGTLKTHDDAADGRFRGRLKLDEKPGSLTITDMTTEHTGDYKLQIISSRGITNKRFVVSVSENISVEEGKNRILNPETEIQKDDLILWRFRGILIAEISGGTLKTHDDADGRFRGRLKLDEKTGSLIITDMRTELTGDYKLQIISSRGNISKRFVVSVSGLYETFPAGEAGVYGKKYTTHLESGEYNHYSDSVNISVEEGKNRILNPETEIQKDDQIQWRFGGILIAEIRGGTLKTHDDADDGRFRGRLKLDEKTGSLTITDMITELTGEYKLQIISSRRNISKRFVVSVSGNRVNDTTIEMPPVNEEDLDEENKQEGMRLLVVR